MPSVRNRRRAQAGTTLVELLVSLVIASLSLALIVGTFSTGLLNATLAKRNTAVNAVVQYELAQVGASTFNPTATSYSECFATEAPINPGFASSFQGSCPDSTYTLRADVSRMPDLTNLQVWSISVSSWPGGSAIGGPVSVYKGNR